MIIRILKWVIKFGVPPYLIFFIAIVVYDIEKNLNYEIIMELTLNAPTGILFLSPIGKFFHYCFHEMKDFNKETIRLAKETSDHAKDIFKNNQNHIENNQDETSISKFKKKYEKRNGLVCK